MNIRNILIGFLLVFSSFVYTNDTDGAAQRAEKLIEEKKSSFYKYGVVPLRIAASFGIPFTGSLLGLAIGVNIGRLYATSQGYIPKTTQIHGDPLRQLCEFTGCAVGSSLGSWIGVLINNKIPPRNHYGKKWSQRIVGGIFPTLGWLGTVVCALNWALR